MGPSQWMLVAVEGRFSGKRFPIPERGFSFGREADNDLVMDDDNVSRHHAVVKIARNRPVLEDLKSRNGTFVNNQKVAKLELHEGDRIALGSHLFKVVPMAADMAPSLEPDPERTIIAQQAQEPRRRAAATQVEIQVGGSPGRVPLHAMSASEGAGASSSSERPVRPNLAGVAEEMPSYGGPVFGGAAEQVVLSGTLPELEPPGKPGAGRSSKVTAARGAPEMPSGLEMPVALSASPMDVASPDRSAGGGRRNRAAGFVVAGVAALVVIVGGIWAMNRGGGPAEEPSGAVAASSDASPAADPGTNATAALLSGRSGSSVSYRKPVTLAPEEQALPPQEKAARSQDHFDQGESFMESEKLKEARDEFERALALDASCKVCLIRLSKVESEIRKTLEKYKSDALRSQKAMEYDKSRRYWEMVLELETDPEGQRIAQQGLMEARNQLHKQSYR